MTMSSSQTYVQGQVLTADSLTKHVTEATPTILTAALDANSQDVTSLDEAGFVNAVANASSTGRLRRNAANLTWHDGTAAGRLFYAGGTDVPVADGGTGLSSGTSGGILGFTATGTLASSVALTANALVLGGGAGATPTPMTGTSGGVPYFNATTTVASSGLLTANGVVYGGGAGAAPASTAQGGTNTVLVASAGVPSFSATPTINTSLNIGVASTTTGTLSLGHASSANLTSFQAGNATEANTYVWPADGGASGQVLTSDGATPTTTLTWGVAGLAAATQAEMEAATSTTTATTPGRTQYHPGVAKVTCRWNAAGTIAQSYNVDSITDTGTGNWTINITTDFSGGANIGVANANDTTGNPRFCQNVSVGTSTAQIVCFDAAGNLADADSICAALYGDQ